MSRRDGARTRIRGGADRGAAVVLAMLLAALAATIAATLFADQQRWTRAVLQRRDQVQAQALVMAGVQWARQIVYGDGRPKRMDHLGEPWAAALPPIPLENGEIRGMITDATARLNVNGLDGSGSAADSGRESLERLFAQRGGPAAAIDAIADWIDADGIVRPNGAEDAYYAGQDVPGLAANGPVARVAELALVRGVSLPALAAVSPFLSALPAGTPVNVNTAPPEVLAAILRDARGDAVAALLARRAERPFSDLADFRARMPQGVTLPGESSLAVRTDYFYVSVEARQGTTIARARALLRRGGAATELPTVVWQVVE
jgi:general secretion pathway protein K